MLGWLGLTSTQFQVWNKWCIAHWTARWSGSMVGKMTWLNWVLHKNGLCRETWKKRSRAHIKHSTPRRSTTYTLECHPHHPLSESLHPWQWGSNQGIMSFFGHGKKPFVKHPRCWLLRWSRLQQNARCCMVGNWVSWCFAQMLCLFMVSEEKGNDPMHLVKFVKAGGTDLF